MSATPPTYKTQNVKDLIRLVDMNDKTYHDPYQWSNGPRAADRTLDVPGPSVSAHNP